MKLWIRVDAAFPRDPEMRELSKRIGVNKMEALGHIVAVWAAMAEHRPSGDLSDISDDTLEDWAQYAPKKKVNAGRFATAFRELFVKEGGARGWQDRQGKLVERAEKDRKRKASGDGIPADIPRTIQGNSSEIPDLRNGTEQYGTEIQTAFNNSVAGFIARLPETHWQEVDHFFTSLGPVSRQYSWLRSLEAKLTGMHPPQASPEVIAQALRQLIANGEKPNWKRFEGYLRSESAPPVQLVRGKQPESKGEGLLLIGELRSKRVHHPAPQGSGVYVIPRPEYEALPQSQRRAVDAIGGLHKIANASDEQFPILASQFAAMYAAANKSTEDAA